MEKWDKLIKSYDLHCRIIAKATATGSRESPDEKIKRMAFLEADYHRWFSYYFRHYAKVKCAPYHIKLAKKVISNKKSKTLARIFRSGGKSVHVNIGIPLYLDAIGELHFMILVGENEIKAKRLLGDLQAELEHNALLIADYGSKLSKGNWADGNFYTTTGKRFMALGFGQSPRGLREGAQRPDYISIDDVDTRKHINNNKIMSEAVDYINEEVMGCFDAGDHSRERLVIANNDFDKRSITHRMMLQFQKNIKIDKDNLQPSDYYVLSVPAVKDLASFQPSWPEKTSADFWRKKYQKNPKAFLREYMHIHVDEGKIFKAEYFRHDKMLPLARYDALVFIGDLSYKDTGDYKAMYLIGKKGKEYHVIYSFLRQTGRRVVAAWLYDKYIEERLERYNIKYLFDGLFAQDEFVNDFDAEGDERGYYVPIAPNKKSYGNKYDHIESTEGRFLRGWVVFNIAEKNSPDQITTIEQYLSFEKGSQAHDDGPDAIAAGIKELDKITYIEKFDPRITARETYANNDY